MEENKKSSFKFFDGKTEKLQNLCNSITDCDHSTPEWTETGKIIVRNFNIKNGRLLLDKLFFTNEETFIKRTSRSKPESGDLIITREAPMGEVCIIPEGLECCLGQRVVLIKPDSEKVDSVYLLYAIQSEFVQKQIKQSEKTGSIVSNLRIPDLKDILIPVTKHQQKIAAVLSSLDSKIELNNKINTELEAMAKTLYDYWFVQFDFPDKDGKPYKTSGGKMVWNDELKREIPDGWEVVKINETITVKDGTHDSPKSQEIGYPFITSKHLLKSGIDFDSANLISESDFIAINKRSKVETGDILFSMIGTIGTIYKVEEKEINFAIKNVALFKTSKKKEVKNYVYMYLKSPDMQQYISNVLSGSIQKFIGLGDLRNIPLMLSENTIEQFEKITAPIFLKIENKKIENQTLSNLRDWLLPMLMNGQVTVN
jgi:type I restriction enzyme S subunit